MFCAKYQNNLTTEKYVIDKWDFIRFELRSVSEDIPHFNGPLQYHYRHYGDVIMSAMVSQITSLTIVYSIICSGADQRKHQSSASLALVRGIHRGPVNSLHKGPVTWKKVSIWWRHDDTLWKNTELTTTNKQWILDTLWNKRQSRYFLDIFCMCFIQIHAKVPPIKIKIFEVKALVM